MGKLKFKSSIFCLIVFFLTKSVTPQSLNMQSIPADKIQLGLSFEKPFYSTDRNLSAFSGVYQLHSNIPLNSKLNIVTDIPVINFTYEIIDYSFDNNFGYTINSHTKSRLGLGNIFLGLQSCTQRSENKNSILTFGVFLPTADEEVSFYGLLINYNDFQKYSPNSFGFYLNYAFHKEDSARSIYGFEIGPNFLVPTKKYSNGELLIHYGITGGFQVNKLLISAELLGMFILTEDIENFGDRFVHSFNLGAQWRDDVVNPKIFYKIYLDQDINHMIDGVLGLALNISI